MKILQINTVVNIGSTGRIVETIGEKILNNKWDSTIAYSKVRPYIKSSSRQITIGNWMDFYSHVLLTRMFDKHGYGSQRTTKKLIHDIARLNPDLIHLHNVHGYYLNIELLFNYLKNTEIPVVWTLHDCWAFTGHCVHFEQLNCEKWKTICFECPIVKSYPKSWLVDNSRSNFLKKKKLFSSLNNITLVTVSEWLNKVVSESFLMKKDSRIIYNGIDLSTFKISDTNKEFWLRRVKSNTDSFIVLAVTNIWTKDKGLNDVISLSRLLPSDYRIVIVGVTNKQKRSLPASIYGVERTKNIEELVELYNIASVFINPTYEDNFPTTNIEALACGTPVVTYNTGGSPEAIDDETGYVVKKGDVDELVSVIKEVCKQGKDYYKTKCRIRAEKFFNKEDRYNDYIELYKEILNKRDVTIQK